MSAASGAAIAQPAVTAIVLNYNGAELLDVVIPSLERQTYPNLSVILVDNGSSDGSADHARARWPQVRVGEIAQNVGVAGALNRGILESTTELVALLNNDIELEPDWLERLVAGLLQHPEAASASGKMLRFDERTVIDAAGDAMRWSSACTNRGAGETDEGQYDAPRPVFSACAGAALYRRAAFDEVGLFDEDFFAYFEDIDWSLRAQLRRLGSWYEPAAVAYHKRGATTSGSRDRYRPLQRRNQIWLVAKDYPGGMILRHLPKIVLLNLGLALQDMRQGAFRSTLRGWWDALRGLPRVLRKRRRIQRARTADSAYLATVISPEPWAEGTLRERARRTARTIAPALSRKP